MKLKKSKAAPQVIVVTLPNEGVKICVAALRAVGPLMGAKIWRPPYGLEGPMPSEFLVAPHK
jgi:hypothetical protein